jgi:hypothetical protein
MVSFKSFVNEANSLYGTSKSEGDPTGVILSMPGMLRSIKTGNVLYRGMVVGLNRGASVISSKGTQRYSLATNNLYQIMMDASPALADFPSRTRSIICATNTRSISLYGSHSYIILPFDGTPIAVSATSDFINQEIHLLDDVGVDVFSSSAGEIVKLLGLRRFFTGYKPKFTDIDALDKALEEHEITDNMWDAVKENMFKEGVVERMFNAIKASYKKNPASTFRSLAKKIMTPGSLDLTLVRAGGAFPTSTTGREVWFEGKALALTPSAFIKTFRELEEQLGDDFSSALDLQSISRLS